MAERSCSRPTRAPAAPANADVVPSGGGRVKQLTHDGSADPVWSPDGTKILFLHASTKNGEFFIGLATMKPDGYSISPTGSRSVSDFRQPHLMSKADLCISR